MNEWMNECVPVCGGGPLPPRRAPPAPVPGPGPPAPVTQRGPLPDIPTTRLHRGDSVRMGQMTSWLVGWRHKGGGKRVNGECALKKTLLAFLGIGWRGWKTGRRILVSWFWVMKNEKRERKGLVSLARISLEKWFDPLLTLLLWWSLGS